MGKILALYLVLQCAKYCLEVLNIKHVKAQNRVVPRELAGKIDGELLEKTRQYTIETARFSLCTSLLVDIAIVLFMFFGLLDGYNSAILSLSLPDLAAGCLFFMALYLASQAISIPFSLYDTFAIEKRYGFTTSTFRLWLSDFFVSLLVSTVILSAMIVGVLFLIARFPAAWWLVAWLFLLVFSLFVLYLSPYVIDPLFNRFTPLQDEVLASEISRLAGKAGIRVTRILKMDQSRRSRHSNAYFAGIGKSKRIVIFDTLLAGVTRDQIAAVLAHEMGHWKKHHLLKGIVITEAVLFVGLYLAYRLIDSGVLITIFSISHPTIFANLLISAFLGSMAFFLVTPLLNLISRYHERQSDRYACSLTGNPDALVEALVALSKENLSNIFPHPVYALFHYSHPPVLERIRQIRGHGAGEGTEK